MQSGGFELGLNSTNVLIGTALIITLILFAYKQYPKVLEQINQEFLRQFGHLLGITENTSNKDILKLVFLNYNHSSTKSWVQSMILAPQETRDKAFSLLCNYLQRPQSQLGSITADVVFSLGSFSHRDAVPTLQRFLQETREHWGRYKGSMLAYGPAVDALIHLDSEQSKCIILSELQSCSNQDEYSGLKELLVTKYSSFDLDDYVLRFYADLILDVQQSKRIKQHLMHCIENKADEDRYRIYISILRGFLAKASENLINDDDSYSLKLLLTQLSKYVALDDKEIWDLFIAMLKAEKLGDALEDWLIGSILEKRFSLNHMQNFSLIMLDDNRANKFKKAIAKNFQFSVEENAIISESLDPEKYAACEAVFSIEKYSGEIQVPHCLNRVYSSLVEQTITPTGLFKPSKEIKLIAGDSVSTKLFLIRALVASTKRNFIYVDFKKLIISPDLLLNLSKEAQLNKPCVIFVNNLVETIKLSEDPRFAKKIEAGLSVLKKVSQIGGVDMLTQSNKKFMLSRSLYKNQFEVITEVCSTGYTERKEIYRHYSFLLRPERDASVFDIDSFIERTNNLSTLEYIYKLLDYLRISLLCSGTLMNIEDYQNLMPSALEDSINNFEEMVLND